MAFKETNMPFVEQDPRLYTREGILALDPGQTGVYGIFNATTWIYVGKAEDLRERLLEHLNGDNPCITRYSPTKFVGEKVQLSNLDAREKELIRELSPVCCKRVG